MADKRVAFEFGANAPAPSSSIAAVLDGSARWHVEQGDCLAVLRAMPSESVHAVVTDPPSGIAFMGREWDTDKGGRDKWIAWLAEILTECRRVMRPGAHALVWALPRTSYWTAAAIDEAGLEVRDCISHIFGSGFPKSLNIGRNPSFCQCSQRTASPSHSDASTGRELGADHHTSNDPVCAEESRRDNGECDPSARPRVLDSLVDCQSSPRSSGELPPIVSALSLASEPSRGDARIRSRSGRPSRRIQEGIEHTHTLSPHSDRLSTRGSLLPVVSEIGSNEGTATSTTPTSQRDLDTELLARSTNHKGEFVSAFPECSTCGKPIANGWGTALKPSSEHWWLARKPLCSTVAANVQRYECGGINVDGCRVEGAKPATTRGAGGQHGKLNALPAMGRIEDDGAGRWPPNTVFSHSESCTDATCDETCPVAELDRQSGVLTSGDPGDSHQNIQSATFGQSRPGRKLTGFGDTGTASRFFPVFRYEAKPSRGERDAGLDGRNGHPTVKPTDLMRWLVRLVTPPRGIVLDPFTGSGTTGVACALEQVRFVGIEREAEYVEIARARITEADGRDEARQLSLLGGAR